MNRDKAVVEFVITSRNFSVDLEIPLDITANELVNALNIAYDLGIDTGNVKDCYLKAERPIVLLKGDKTLDKFGVCNGTVIYFTE